jgi:two-component system, cell cycle response regulator DivK
MHRPHALIVDDNSQNLMVLNRLLVKEGFQTTQASHPDQLNAVLPTLESVSIVFLDLELPGNDGFAILDMLRVDPRFAGVPIVAYTVHLSEIRVAHQRGFHSFLGKPLDSERFPEQLARILAGEQVWETA